jgi:GMP synthase-like glutamine amidotransferase
MSAEVLRYQVLQHVSFETAGLLGEVVRESGHSIGVTRIFEEERMPGVVDFDVLIVMGGPMSVHDEVEYPWLADEKRLIAAAIQEGKKVLGICLGAQLIAEVCGGRVHGNPEKEIGFWPVKWVGEGAGSVGAGDTAERSAGEVVFHWHGETFDLPPGAELLASSDVCVNQAFRIGDRVLGIQFHPEVTPEIIRAMVEHEGWELVEAGFVQGRDRILTGAEEMEEGRGMGRGVRGIGRIREMAWLWDWLKS